MKLSKAINEIEDSEKMAELSANNNPYTITEVVAFISLFKVVLTILLSAIKLFTGPKADREIDKFLEFINKK